VFILFEQSLTARGIHQKNRGSKMRSTGSLFIAFGLIFGVTSGASAQPVADFYRGKQISLLIPSGPGGGYDLYARFLGRFLGKHVPGNPGIIPKNMPGAGGIVAGNGLLSLGAPDGLTMAGIQFTNTLNQIVKTQNMRFDMRQLAWIGSMNSTSTICAFSGKSRDLQGKDVLAQEILLGATTGSVTMVPLLLNNLAGTKFKLVQGYPSTSNVQLAMENGEVNGLCGWSWDGARVNAKSMIDRGIAKVALDIAVNRHDELKGMNVPFLMDFLPEGENKDIIKMILSPQEYSRPFAFPPGIPADRLTAVRQSFAKMMQDPEVKAEAEKVGLELRYLDADGIQKLLKETFDVPEALLKRASVELEKAGFKE
jgi:tripartite-type tricarboxylate transporter receptor subunit TctC